MKIVITISGQTLDSPFDPRFGRGAAFCLVDSETGEWSVHANPALSASGGAGVQAAQFVAKLGAQAVISGAFGPNAADTLASAGIKMYLAPAHQQLSAAQVLELFKAAKLRIAETATHTGNHRGGAR